MHRIATIAILICSVFLAGGSSMAQSRVRGVSLLPIAPLWSRELPFGDAVRLVIGDSRVLVATDARIDALSWATGEPAWISELATTVPPLVHDGRVFAAADDQIHALTELTGRVEWRLPVGPVTVPLVYRAGWLFVVGDNGKLRGVRAADGVVIWEGAGSAKWALQPVVDGDSVFGLSTDGVLTAWRVSDGSQLWQIQATPEPVAMLPAHGHVYIATNGRLTSYRQTDGARRWSYEVEMPVVSRLAADLAHVYLATVDNSVRAHRAGNGHLVWKRTVDARVVDGLTADGSHVLVPQSDGTVRFMLTETGVRAGQLNAPGEDSRGARAIATSGYGPTLRIVRMTVSDTAGRRVEAFMRQSREVTAATSLTGTPVPLSPPPVVKRP